MIDPLNAAMQAYLYLFQEKGPPRIAKTSAIGAAVHFGEFGMFIPGESSERIMQLIQQRTDELACAFVAYQEALRFEEAAKQGDGAS